MGIEYNEQEENLLKKLYESGVKPKEISKVFKDKGFERTSEALSLRASIKGYNIKISNLKNEVWKINKNYPNNLVSNMGRIKTSRGRILSTRVHFGYLDCRIINKDGKRKSPRIHRLVAETFIPNPNNKPCVNHIDGNKLNNKVKNLEWVTYSENNKHAHENGLLKSTSEWDKLTEKDVHKICKRLEKGESVTDIHTDYQIVTRRAINGIENGNNWVRISSQYNI